MGKILARGSVRGWTHFSRIRARVCAAAFVAAMAVYFSGCTKLQPVDTSALINTGMNDQAVQQLDSLKISTAEVGEIAEARQSGLSDDDCVAIYKIYKSRHQAFDAGDAVAGLMQVGMSGSDVIELAQLSQLGLDWGELQAMKLAGLSNAIVMEEAQQRSDGKSVLSGAMLARLKNTGVHESTLLKLVQRAIPDSEGRQILAARRRGVSENEILHHFTGS